MVRQWSVVVGILAFTQLACGGATQNGAIRTGMAALGAQVGSQGHYLELYDLNGDGEADLWKVHTETPGETEEAVPVRQLIRKDMDLNFDGKVDVRQHLDAQLVVVREVMDLDFDGTFEAVVYYEAGILTRRELDLNFDGKPDVVKHYVDGKLVRKERSSRSSGVMDTWEYYESGRLMRIGRDRDGDGQPEVFDDAPVPDPEFEDPTEEEESAEDNDEESAE